MNELNIDRLKSMSSQHDKLIENLTEHGSVTANQLIKFIEKSRVTDDEINRALCSTTGVNGEDVKVIRGQEFAFCMRFSQSNLIKIIPPLPQHPLTDINLNDFKTWLGGKTIQCPECGVPFLLPVEFINNASLYPNESPSGHPFRLQNNPIAPVSCAHVFLYEEKECNEDYYIHLYLEP